MVTLCSRPYKGSTLRHHYKLQLKVVEYSNIRECVIAPRLRNGITRPQTTASPMFLRGYSSRRMLAPCFAEGICPCRNTCPCSGGCIRPWTNTCPMFLRGYSSVASVDEYLPHVFERVFVRGRIVASCF